MQNYVLFADSDCDITPVDCAKYGFHLISMPYSIDGKTTYPYEDFEVFEADAYYDMLRGGVIPTTSAINKEKYIEYFEPFFKEGKDILYTHFSRTMSATFNNMDKAVEELLAKYPERKFYAIDTKGISILGRAIDLVIGEMYLAGKTPEEIVAWANENVDRYACYFFVDDLKFLQKSGRVSGIAGAMGTLLGIRPIIQITAEGKMPSIGKEKGRNKAVARLVQYVKELGDDAVNHPIYIASAGADDLAEMIREALIEEFGDGLNIEIVTVNPTNGAHCGPESTGVCFRAIHR